MDQWLLRDGNEVQRKIGGIQRTLYFWWKSKVADPVGKIDDYAKHNFQRTPPGGGSFDKNVLFECFFQKNHLFFPFCCCFPMFSSVFLVFLFIVFCFFF